MRWKTTTTGPHSTPPGGRRWARPTLVDIAEERITDPDVLRYVGFCKELAQYCIDHGIQRDAGLNFWSVVTTADKQQTAKTGFLSWWHREIAGPVASLVHGGALAYRRRGWFKLQEQLAARYDGHE